MTTPLPSADPEQVGLSARQLGRITEALERAIETHRTPGVTALIARRGQIAYFEALGLRDPALGEKLKKDAIFRIYSMTKPIVSVAAMMLFEDGRFLLSEPLA